MTSIQPFRTLLAVLPLLVACGGDSSGPGPTPGAPASIVFVSGASQSALAGTVVSASPVVQVRDAAGLGVPSIGVTFQATAGSGTVAPAQVMTDASGFATSPAWTLGKVAVPQALTASAVGLSATVSATVTTSYSVVVRFFGASLPPAAAAAFQYASARISAMITGEIQDIAAPAGGIDLKECGAPGQTLTGTVDDIVIYASVDSIDGAGKVLAQAGPCFIRTPSNQTIVGIMSFDSADIKGLITANRLNDVVLHEMIHVVGLGPLWGSDAFSLLSGAGTANSRYTGHEGVQGCLDVGGSIPCGIVLTVPVHSADGPGSADGHWRESVFGSEIMTPFINVGSSPLSVMSIKSLADEGYVVNIAAADPYSVPPMALSSIMMSQAAPGSVWERTLKPLFRVTPTGRLLAVEKR